MDNKTCLGLNNKQQTGDNSVTSLFSETKGLFCFSFNKRPPKDATLKSEFFAYVISRKRIANHQNQLQNDVIHVKSIQSAEN